MATTKSISWTGKPEKTARREFFYYDETDLIAMHMNGWKMHIGVKPNSIWWNQKYYPAFLTFLTC